MNHLVVLAPDIVGGAFFDPVCRRVLEQWRDGLIMAVLNRDLLLLYLKLLRELGLGSDLVRHWMLWFTSPEKVIYMEMIAPGKTSVLELCIAVGSQARVTGILCWRQPEVSVDANGERVGCFTAAAFLKLHGCQRP